MITKKYFNFFKKYAKNNNTIKKFTRFLIFRLLTTPSLGGVLNDKS